MPTFKEAKRADRLAAIGQMDVKDVPPHWGNDPGLAAAIEARAHPKPAAKAKPAAPVKSQKGH